MIVGPSGRVHDPQNQLFLTLETPKLLKLIQEKPTLRIEAVRKDVCRKFLDMHLIDSCKSCIWEDLRKHMKWKSGTKGT